MDNLDNIQKALYQVKATLKTDSNIRKLLYYTDSDISTQADVPYTVIDNYIVLRPVFNVDTEPFNKSSFISINLVDLEDDEDIAIENGTLRVNVMCKNTIWEMANDKIRPIYITGLVKSLLNGTKFNISNKLDYVGMQLVVLNEEISGYMVLFSITEGSGLENEF